MPFSALPLTSIDAGVVGADAPLPPPPQADTARIDTAQNAVIFVFVTLIPLKVIFVQPQAALLKI